MKKRSEDAGNGFDQWGGYMDAKKAKLEEQFAQDALNNPYKESNLFTGISIFVNGLTNPTADELKRIMMKNGGVYHAYQRSSTTFVIASNLADVKVRQITTAKIISPKWIVDCLEQKRIVDYSKYLLYTNCKTTQPKITFTKTESNAKKTETECDDEKVPNIVQNLNALNLALRNFDGSPKAEPVKQENVMKLENESIREQPNKGTARTAVDPNFLAEFYNNSRLHHIATLGAGFKNYVSKLRDSHKGDFSARNGIRKQRNDFDADIFDQRTTVMHIDMDCFFVSVGLRTRPHLKGQPIAVTHSKGGTSNKLKSGIGVDRQKEMELYIKRHDDRHNAQTNDDTKANMPAIDNTTSLSEIASCSYEARKCGVKNGMFVGAALKLCPQLKTIPYDFDGYKEVAQTLYDTVTQYTLDVEAVSCDEMYVNLTDVLTDTNMTADEFVTHLRNEITEKTGCPCSAGVGSNKLQARMATKKAKPNGQYHLNENAVEDYFSAIMIADLPGVGYSTTMKLKRLNLLTCKDLQQLSLIQLQQEFGKKLGESLYQHCRGIDEKPLVYDQIRKSVSAEVNYGIRFTETHELDTFLKQLCAEVHNRLTEIDACGRTITLKYMVRAAEAPVETAKFMGHGFCDHVTKSTTVPKATDDLTLIMQNIFNIKNILNVEPKELRGIGIQISKLEKNTQMNGHGAKNMLKEMFEKVAEKKSKFSIEMQSIDVPFHSKMVKEEAKPIFSLRKVKSFESPPSKNDIGKMFAGITEKAKSKSNLNDGLIEKLDLDVLAELPEEIRNEILCNQNVLLKNLEENKQKTNSTARKIENDFKEDEHLKSSTEKKISEDNILAKKEWRHVLANWMESTNEPMEYDINVVIDHFRDFLNDQRFCEIHLILRFLHRKISETENCKWHQVYYSIVNVVQHHVAAIHGENCTLLIDNDFECKNCYNRESIL